MPDVIVMTAAQADQVRGSSGSPLVWVDPIALTNGAYYLSADAAAIFPSVAALGLSPADISTIQPYLQEDP